MPDSTSAGPASFSDEPATPGHIGPGRRRFVLIVIGLASSAMGLLPGRGFAQDPHPTPRPSIDASRVVRTESLDNPKAARAFDLVREIPQLIDGIRCHCGCAKREGASAIAMKIQVDPTVARVPTSGSGLSPYLGDYILISRGEAGERFEESLRLIERNGRLHGVVRDGKWDFDLIPAKVAHRFYVAFVENGEVIDVEDSTPVVFELSGGRATGFVAQGFEKEPWMRAVRKQ